MRLLSALLLCASTLAAQEIPRQEYAARRAKLAASLPNENDAVLLFGAEEPADMHDRFFQEANFLYLTGWREPGAALLLSRDSQILFLPPRSHQSEWYTGRRIAPGDADAPSATGFRDIRPIAKLEDSLPDQGRLYALAADPRATKLIARRLFQPSGDATPMVTRLRLIKSPAEIAMIERATRDSIAGHLAAWERTQPGVWEYQIATTLTNTYFDRGCERNAYPPIVGSGPNSVALHYSALNRQVQPNETVVMDVGAECADYATDLTRTVPSSGKFTARQREIYEIVLAAQKAAIAAVKPGIALTGRNSLHRIAYDYINTHGKDASGEPLGKYFMHGLGHYVGLDVHDPGDYGQPLEAGMVITIEPGIYIPQENIGIRIEDVVLVTEDGARVLSSGLPRELKDIEGRTGPQDPAVRGSGGGRVGK